MITKRSVANTILTITKDQFMIVTIGHIDRLNPSSVSFLHHRPCPQVEVDDELEVLADF